MDLNYISKIFPTIIDKLPITLFVFLLSLVFALILALLMTLIRLKKVPILHPLLEGYISFAIANPGLIHIFIVYYGVPMLFNAFGINLNGLDKLYFVIIALSFYAAAFMSQILKPSYESISANQMEAALSIGYTERQANWRIIFPQVIPIALPGMGNAIIDLFKDTSMIFLIGIIDMMGQADILIANSYGVSQLEVYFLIAVIYWLISALLSFVLSRLEKRTAKFVE